MATLCEDGAAAHGHRMDDVPFRTDDVAIAQGNVYVNVVPVSEAVLAVQFDTLNSAIPATDGVLYSQSDGNASGDAIPSSESLVITNT